MHFVGRVDEAGFRPIPGGDGQPSGYSRFALVDAGIGSMHIGAGLCQLAPGGRLDRHAHAFEEGFSLLQGQVVLTVGGEAHQLGPNDCGFIPVGAVHRWQNDGPEPARWLEALAPQPKPAAASFDTVFFGNEQGLAEAALGELRDPRPPYFGHLDPAAPPSSVAGATVYSTKRTQGLCVRPVLSQHTGTQLFWLIMPHLDPGGWIAGHDHPFEEMYLFLGGEVEMVLDGDRHVLRPGDFVWSGVGCVHSFANHGSTPADWLEIMAPQPPSGHWQRFPEDWEEVRRGLGSR